eukprot:jgi/Botrbrau1/7565/Bobra.0159s0015.1
MYAHACKLFSRRCMCSSLLRKNSPDQQQLPSNGGPAAAGTHGHQASGYPRTSGNRVPTDIRQAGTHGHQPSGYPWTSGNRVPTALGKRVPKDIRQAGTHGRKASG